MNVTHWLQITPGHRENGRPVRPGLELPHRAAVKPRAPFIGSSAGALNDAFQSALFGLSLPL